MSNEGPLKETLIGKTLDDGRYEIVKLIGEGGMGKVYQARQISMDRMVALKILRAQLALDEQLLARFQQEALSVSRLRHPNTITVYDFGRTKDGLLFIAMELLGGKSLYQLLRQKKRLSLHRALHIMGQVVGAVSEAHQLGVVHRDLKPENIQIDEVGNDPYFAKVLDFGIAKIVHGEGGEPGGKTLTMAGAIFGTPAYMSPEQVHGEKVDHRTDVYSLGIILYELLAGRQPFTGATPMAIMMAQASKEVPPIRGVAPEADVNDAILAVLDRCLAKDREARFGGADELLRAMQQVQVQIGDLARSQMMPRDSQWGSGLRPPLREDASLNQAANAAMASAPTITPLPDDDEHTPSPAAGHVLTVPPPVDVEQEDLLGIPSNRGRWLAVAALLLVGGGFALWMSQGPAVDPDPVAPETTPVATAQPQIIYTVKSDPPGAKVFDGDLNLGNTPIQKTWRRGLRKQLRFELAGHDPQTIELSGEGEDEQTRTILLKPILKPPAPFRLTSTPPGAEIVVAGKTIGKTPFRWTPPMGDGPINFRFELAKHTAIEKAAHRQTVDIGPVDVEVTLEPEKPKVVARPRPRPRSRPRPRPAAPKSARPARPAAPKTRGSATKPAAPATKDHPYKKL